MIFTGATILSGVVIGDWAFVGAESVVTKNVESYSVVVGNPTGKIKDRNHKQEYTILKTPFLY